MKETITFLHLDKDIKNYIVDNFSNENDQIKIYRGDYIEIGRNQYNKLIITLQYIPTKVKKFSNGRDNEYESFTQEEFRKEFLHQ